jgi:hypothetical protein
MQPCGMFHRIQPNKRILLREWISKEDIVSSSSSSSSIPPSVVN